MPNTQGSGGKVLQNASACFDQNDSGKVLQNASACFDYNENKATSHLDDRTLQMGASSVPPQEDSGLSDYFTANRQMTQSATDNTPTVTTTLNQQSVVDNSNAQQFNGNIGQGLSQQESIDAVFNRDQSDNNLQQNSRVASSLFGGADEQPSIETVQQ